MKTTDFLSALYNDRPVRVVDAGARDGFRFLNILHPYSEVHLLEPDPASAAVLKSMQFGFKAVHIHDIALGKATGTGKLHVTKHGSMSSLLEPRPEEFHRGFGQMKNALTWEDGLKVVATIDVPTQTLNGFHASIGGGFIDFLKLDTQGSEFQILQSGEDMLRTGKVGVICCEVSHFPIYQDQGYFSDIDIFLRKCGFRLVEYKPFPDSLEREDEFTPGSKIYERASQAPMSDAWYVYDWDRTNTMLHEERKRSAVVLASNGSFSQAAYLLAGLVDERDMNELFRQLSASVRESGFKHFLRRWMPPAVQQWRAKRKR